MFIPHVFVIKLEDFSVKCVDKDKLHLVEGEIYDETNFPAAFLHGGSEVRWWRERCLQVKRVDVTVVAVAVVTVVSVVVVVPVVVVPVVVVELRGS